MEGLTVKRGLAQTATAYGAVRAVVHGVFLVYVLRTDFASLGRLPVTIMHPPGLMEYFSWKFYDRLITPVGMTCLKWLLVAALLSGMIGYLTRLSVPCSAALVLLYQGILRSFGHFNHDEMLGIYCLLILAVTPCGDGFAVDRLGEPTPTRRRSFVYGYPIFMMQLLMAWIYCTSGLLKLRLSGTAYFLPDNLTTIAISHSLDNLHDTQFKIAFWLPAMRSFIPMMTAAAVTWEILFPLCLVWRRTTLWFLGIGVVFHMSSMLVLNITFPSQLALYLIFVNWERAGTIARRLPCHWRILTAWQRSIAIPERFDHDVRVADVSVSGLLLWDGDCGFCAKIVKRLHRWARRPFTSAPFQSMAAGLPQSVRKWSSRQMHWVFPDGHVVGGSRALVEVLAASGHPALAGLLDCQVVRPFTWFAYRVIASNRHRLGAVSGDQCESPNAKGDE